MIAEDLHRRFGVRVVCGFEAQLGNADLLEESANSAYQVTECKVAISHKTFHLVKLTKVRGIHGLVTEHAVDREVFHGSECTDSMVSGSAGRILLSKTIQHLRRNSGSVCAQNVLERFLTLEIATIPDTPSAATILVRFLHDFIVFLRHSIAAGRTLHKECIMRIARWVTLRLKQSIKVPERRLNPFASRHLFEAHLHQNAPKFCTHFE
mmetsp:Transcript_7485/g.15111  ORF Transcript_7485/g.15111 Transcript_7485/m.15111 type:complete len:209 (+) Transcript_7485:347-973(+)